MESLKRLQLRKMIDFQFTDLYMHAERNIVNDWLSDSQFNHPNLYLNSVISRKLLHSL